MATQTPWYSSLNLDSKIVDAISLYENYGDKYPTIQALKYFYADIEQLKRSLIEYKNPEESHNKQDILRITYEKIALAQSMEYNVKRLQSYMFDIDYAVKYQTQLDEGIITLDGIVELHTQDIQNGKFTCCFQDELSNLLLETMRKIIKSIPGAEEWFRTDGKLNSNHPIRTKLTDHPAKYGHTGASMSWTFSIFRNIYQNGIESFILSTLLSKGIGWNYIDFDTALNYENEDACVWILKNQQHQFDDDELERILEECIKQSWPKLTKVLLDMYELSDRGYESLISIADKSREWSVFWVLKENWQQEEGGSS